MIDIEKIKSQKSIKELLEFSIINVDKPSGPTSFTVSQFVKTSLGLKKTSHLGTLDPAVTGVLPVALNRACRLNEYLMHRDKTYIGIMRLHEDVSQKDLEKEMKKFIGKITQLPPKRSSVKRAERQREVKTFKLIEKKDRDALFLAEVQAGTYIRTLCHDLGKKIGGAHMLELRRTQAGIFLEIDKKYPSVNLYDFEKAIKEYKTGNEKPLKKILIPGEIISHILPVIKVRKDVIKKLHTGSPIFPSFLESKTRIKNLNNADKVCAFAGEKFIGCYSFVGSDTLTAKAEFVFN